MSQAEMSATIAGQLEASPLFKGVALDDRQELVGVMTRQTLEPGALLFEKGSQGDSIYIILSGRIRIFTEDEHGQEFTIRHLEPPNTLGEFAILDQKPRSASAAAAAPSEVMVLHRDEFLRFLDQRPLVGLSMMRNLVERVRYTTTYLQKVMDATQKLAEGAFDAALDDMPPSGTDAEIQGLIGACVQMMRSVQTRQALLQGTTAPPPEDS